jgi:hypothetical protein
MLIGTGVGYVEKSRPFVNPKNTTLLPISAKAPVIHSRAARLSKLLGPCPTIFDGQQKWCTRRDSNS